MLKNRWFNALGPLKKDFLIVFILLVNALTWQYMAFLVMNGSVNAFNWTNTETFAVLIIYYVSIIISSLIGSILSNIRRLRFIYAWLILGTASSLLPALPNVPSYVWSFALGFSFGVGMPICLAYFADHSTVENRGSIGGIVFLAFNLSVAFITIAFTLLNLTAELIIFAIWRAAGLLLIILLKPKDTINIEKRKHVSFAEVLKDKSSLLYLIPWVTFLMIDRFEGPVLGPYLANPSLSSASIIWPIIGSFSAFFGGLLSDWIGRKRVVVGGFVALGLAYAAIGIAPNVLISWYFYTAVDGLAWGMLFVIFFLTIWGDLSELGGREKYYVIGGIPFYFVRVVESSVASQIMKIPEYAAFSLASFFLFVAVLPLLYAPETLPEKKIELRRLKGYIEQAKRVREKHLNKNST